MGYQRHRLPRQEYLGKRRYFLTFCTKHRRPLFIDTALVAVVECELLRTAERLDFAVSAYCFMPDHVHLLAIGTTDISNLLLFARVAKQKSGFAARQIGLALWQPSWFDRILREDDDDMATIAYIVNNPVRAGLVASVAEWHAWGSQLYTREALIDAISTHTNGFRM